MRYLSAAKEVLQHTMDLSEREVSLLSCTADTPMPSASARVDLGAPRVLDIIIAVVTSDDKYIEAMGPYLVTRVQGVSTEYRMRPRAAYGIWTAGMEQPITTDTLDARPQFLLWTRYDGYRLCAPRNEIYLLRAPINRVTLGSVASLELNSVNSQRASCARCGALLRQGGRSCLLCE